MKSLLLVLYYLVISKLPHSRFGYFFNWIRRGYVCKFLKIMKYHPLSYFEPNVYIGNARNVKIGSHCHINENVFIQGANIGSYVMIAPNVSILSSSHLFIRSDVPMIKQGQRKNEIVQIYDDVWIGRNVIIMPGISIGRGSIVAAGAIVTKDVPDFSIVAGIPAKIISHRETYD